MEIEKGMALASDLLQKLEPKKECFYYYQPDDDAPHWRYSWESVEARLYPTGALKVRFSGYLFINISANSITKKFLAGLVETKRNQFEKYIQEMGKKSEKWLRPISECPTDYPVIFHISAKDEWCSGRVRMVNGNRTYDFNDGTWLVHLPNDDHLPTHFMYFHHLDAIFDELNKK